MTRLTSKQKQWIIRFARAFGAGVAVGFFGIWVIIPYYGAVVLTNWSHEYDLRQVFERTPAGRRLVNGRADR
jgi:hypothetical protein